MPPEMLNQITGGYLPKVGSGTRGDLKHSNTWNFPVEKVKAFDRWSPAKEVIRAAPLDGPSVEKWTLGDKHYSIKKPVFEMSRFNIDSEISDLTSEDQSLQLVLSRILPNLEAKISTLGKGFKIRVETIKDKDMPDWRNANIIAEIEDDDFDELLNLWEQASAELRTLLKSLGQTKDISERRANELNNFINISFVPIET